MKNFKILLLSLVLFATGMAISSCGNAGDKSATTDQQGKEYTSAYICPMHCEGSGSDKMGTCPVCKMDYVANKEHGHDGHSHEGHNHDGHSH